MSKTPEQMAEEYTRDWWPDYKGVERCSQVHAATRQAFLAGYQAAKDQLADADKVMRSSNNSNNSSENGKE